MIELDGLDEFCTVRQLEIISTIRTEGTASKAAKVLGINERSVFQTLAHIRKKAANRGYSPNHDMTHVVPDGYQVKGISTYYNSEGKPSGQWVKSSVDAERQAELQKVALEAMSEDIVRLAPIDKPTSIQQSHLCNVYTLTDSHVGMLAWNQETQTGDWDLSIAEKVLVGCFKEMISSSPKAETGIVAQLGDFMHYDSVISPITPMHGHILDADGRMQKMVKVAVRILRTVIDLSLQRHDRVVVLMAEGNHDMTSSVWLRAMFQALYENEPRVLIIDSELPYYTYQHGSTMLAWHHGHLHKNDKLPILFASQFPKLWGDTTKRYCHTGHRHHAEEKEHSGMTVIQHPTLAARDAYASRGGWVAERSVSSITYSDKFGQVARNIITPEMLSL